MGTVLTFPKFSCHDLEGLCYASVMAKRTSYKGKRTSFIPFLNFPRRTQVLLLLLLASTIFATVYFSTYEPSIASLH